MVRLSDFRRGIDRVARQVGQPVILSPADAELSNQARGSLLEFARQTHHDYRANWHHALLCERLAHWLHTPGDRLIVNMPPRHGKALAVYTPIPTPTGWVAMGELRPGDQVFGDDGNPCNVVAISPVWQNRTVYRVEMDDGSLVVADADHLWRVRLCRKRDVFKLKTTAQLRARTSERAPMVERQLPLSLPDAQLPIDPYVLGVWLGDGCSRHATITQGSDDYDFIRAQVAAVGYATSDRATAGTFGVLGLSAQLRRINLLDNKHVPPVYLRGSLSQRLALLQGLIDTDGHVALDGQVEFCSTNLELAEAARELVFSLGRKASLHVGRATIGGRDCGVKYRVMFYMADAARLPRKAERCRDASKTPHRYIQAVTECGWADTVCIQVDSPTSMFLCGRSMIPTHNSEMVSRQLPAWGLGHYPDDGFLICSYGASLAHEMHADVQRIMARPAYERAFPTIRLARPHSGEGTRRADLATVAGRRGVLRASGAGGPIVGKGFRFGVIDDPLKNRAEAESPTIRERLKRWYSADFATRAEPGARILITMTRYHEDDLVGHLLGQAADSEAAERWDVLNLPALAGADGKHPGDPRQPGEALWPDRYPLERLAAIRARSEYDWWSLYQGDPRQGASSEWPASHFGEHLWFSDWPDLAIRGVAVDASKGAADGHGDYTAIVAGGRCHQGHLWAEAWLERLAPEAVAKRTVDVCELFKPDVCAVEGNLFQELFLVMMAQEAQARGVNFPGTPLVNSVNKEVRIRRLGPDLGARRIHIRATPGGRLLVDQLRQFPLSQHDDGPDALEMLKRVLVELWNGRHGKKGPTRART